MSTAAKEVFLTALISELVSRYPKWPIEDHCKVQCMGQPKNMWPEADIVINMPGRQFIVAYDEDCEPGRNLVKYWPIICHNKRLSLTIIEVWKGGRLITCGFHMIAKWINARLEEHFSGTIYEFIERTDEPAELIANKVAQIILGREPIQSKDATTSLDAAEQSPT